MSDLVVVPSLHNRNGTPYALQHRPVFGERPPVQGLHPVMDVAGKSTSKNNRTNKQDSIMMNKDEQHKYNKVVGYTTAVIGTIIILAMVILASL